MSNNPFPSVEEVKKWSLVQVINFLESKKDELFLYDEDIDIIKRNRVAGRAFLELSKEDLQALPYNLLDGPARAIAGLVRDIKGEEQGKYHNCIQTFQTYTVFFAIISFINFCLANNRA